MCVAAMKRNVQGLTLTRPPRRYTGKSWRQRLACGGEGYGEIGTGSARQLNFQSVCRRQSHRLSE